MEIYKYTCKKFKREKCKRVCKESKDVYKKTICHHPKETLTKKPINQTKKKYKSNKYIAGLELNF